MRIFHWAAAKKLAGHLEGLPSPWQPSTLAPHLPFPDFQGLNHMRDEATEGDEERHSANCSGPMNPVIAITLHSMMAINALEFEKCNMRLTR